ncbi:hypothetical protein K503DRAFT_416166 [Rhizopogon vinicolor AM-OR11-026]|uniref:Uncharacterized protein n=1 Tax=Rhizopogon vinicolor AM-OR11-026 TaxID=1314800 RepID=A0A1B7NB03_9AGAM|nr:hypothetical protein K503DRAFT_416166 [Rhizopogon vinicolor AM-OR11-026]
MGCPPLDDAFLFDWLNTHSSARIPCPSKITQSYPTSTGPNCWAVYRVLLMLRSYIDWSNLSGGILRTPDALSKVKQLLLNKDRNVSWTELSAILSCAFRAPKKHNYVSISLSKSWGAILWGTSKLQGTMPFFVVCEQTVKNDKSHLEIDFVGACILAHIEPRCANHVDG